LEQDISPLLERLAGPIAAVMQELAQHALSSQQLILEEERCVAYSQL
jgi:hypothetical protein